MAFFINLAYGDLFESLGLGNMQHFQHGGHQEPKGPDINLKVRVTLADVYKGKDIDVQYTRQAICPHCGGSGAESDHDMEVCPRCRGQGSILKKKQIAPGFVQQFQEHCDRCNGEGKIIKNKCHQCHAKKVIKALDELTLEIDRGVSHGHIYEYDDEGDEYLNVKSSTINVKIEVIPDETFTRDGEDLRSTVKITLKEALLGFSKTIKHLDNHEVKLNKFGTTRPGFVQKIIGEGMPHFHLPAEKGDLYVKYEVEFPKTLSDKERALFKQLFRKN
eukprot:CAMPEP_0205828060 /NCGR_PEP_ID=MMETSP0206-20130828/33971_1 /ASSEMBLY_ACC=CAM_ASM_000279 /TAXON_ID=36767 /ORGANISM="Euplotes focardii, Strain TN1" /LENGTH=274 /DNA_ID=CAMNT_0053129513 /DNA_START=91 /DNA_END=915 /DNA_ORIENTATION=+